jgi:hypothetical protein
MKMFAALFTTLTSELVIPMNLIVGLIIFAIGFGLGFLTSMLAFIAYAQSRQVAKGKSVKETPTSSSPRTPVFEIPVMLDAERVVQVGFRQALHEEAKRIGRLN